MLWNLFVLKEIIRVILCWNSMWECLEIWRTMQVLFYAGFNKKKHSLITASWQYAFKMQLLVKNLKLSRTYISYNIILWLRILFVFFQMISNGNICFAWLSKCHPLYMNLPAALVLGWSTIRRQMKTVVCGIKLARQAGKFIPCGLVVDTQGTFFSSGNVLFCLISSLDGDKHIISGKWIWPWQLQIVHANLWHHQSTENSGYKPAAVWSAQRKNGLAALVCVLTLSFQVLW